MATNPYTNKVELSDGTTLVDLTGDTVEPSALAAGYTAHDRSGAPITGTYAQQQADWAQYDSNAADYIKNRPFYYDHDVTTVLAEATYGGYADYNTTISGKTYALMQEDVSLAVDVSAGTEYRVTVGGTAYDATAGASQTFTLSGATSRTMTGVPVVVESKCVIIRTASKKAAVFLYGSAGQYPVSSKTVKAELVVADAFAQIDPMFLPAATSSAYGAVKVDSALDGTSANPVQNQAVKDALDGKAASSHTHPASDITSGQLGVANGGTGAATLTSNAVLTGNGTSAVNTVATASGALYATSANGAAQFGTLPIAQGGTGATSASAAKAAIVDGQALAPASVAATGAVTAMKNNVMYSLGDVGESVSQKADVQSVGGSTQLVGMSFTCTNSSSTRNGHSLLLVIEESGLTLYDMTMPSGSRVVWQNH